MESKISKIDVSLSNEEISALKAAVNVIADVVDATEQYKGAELAFTDATVAEILKAIKENINLLF